MVLRLRPEKVTLPFQAVPWHLHWHLQGTELSIDGSTEVFLSWFLPTVVFTVAGGPRRMSALKLSAVRSPVPRPQAC